MTQHRVTPTAQEKTRGLATAILGALKDFHEEYAQVTVVAQALDRFAASIQEDARQQIALETKRADLWTVTSEQQRNRAESAEKQLVEARDLLQRTDQAITESDRGWQLKVAEARAEEREQCCKDECRWCKLGTHPIIRRHGILYHHILGKSGFYRCDAALIRERATSEAEASAGVAQVKKGKPLIEYLGAAPSVANDVLQDGWIKCSERLPETGVLIDFFTAEHTMDVGWLCVEYEGEQKWQSIETMPQGTPIYFEMEQVTHWRPRPAPPEMLERMEK